MYLNGRIIHPKKTSSLPRFKKFLTTSIENKFSIYSCFSFSRMSIILIFSFFGRFPPISKSSLPLLLPPSLLLYLNTAWKAAVLGSQSLQVTASHLVVPGGREAWRTNQWHHSAETVPPTLSIFRVFSPSRFL